MTKLVYLAHSLSGDFSANRANAKRIAGELARKFDIAPVMDWVWLSEVWDETAENRALGLSIDKELIGRCDEVWLIGPRLSDGMIVEKDYALVCGIRVRGFVAIEVNEIKPEGCRANGCAWAPGPLRWVCRCPRLREVSQ